MFVIEYCFCGNLDSRPFGTKPVGKFFLFYQDFNNNVMFY